MKIDTLLALKTGDIYRQYFQKIISFWNDHNDGVRAWDTISVNSFILNSNTISGAYTSTKSDNIIFIDSSASAFTVTLPSANSNKGQIFVLTITAGTHVVTITTSGGNINGGTSIQLPGQYTTVRVASDGSNYYMI